MQFLVKLTSSVKGTRLLKKESLSHCRRNHWNILGVDENQADLEHALFSNCKGTETSHEKIATFSCETYFRQFVFHESLYVNSPLSFSVCDFALQLLA
jgi:hypothetical protein